MSDDRVAELLEEMISGADGEKRQELITTMLDGDIVGLEYRSDDGNGLPLLVQDANGQLWPIFSSVDTARVAWEELGGKELNAEPVSYKCRELWTEAVRHDMRTALNILSPFSDQFRVDEMSQYLGIGDGQIRVGQPAHVPDELRQNLYEFVAGKENVKTAYLAWMKRADEHEGFLLVVVTDTDPKEIAAGLEVLAAFTEGNTLDLLVQSPDDADNSAAAHLEPFFVGLD